MDIPMDLRGQYVKMKDEQEWLEQYHKDKHRNKWYRIMIGATIAIWVGMFAVAGTVLGLGIYFTSQSSLLGLISVPGLIGVSVVAGLSIAFTNECQQENFGFWFGAHKARCFEYGFDSWYARKFLGASKEKPESDRAKARRLMKEQSKRLEFLAFCDRLNSDPEYRKAYMEASKEFGV